MWSLFPTGHEGSLFHPRMIRPAGRGPARGQTGVSHRVQLGFLKSRPPDIPQPRQPAPGSIRRGVIGLGARASRPHPVPLAAASVRRCKPPCRRKRHRPGRRRAMAPLPVDPREEMAKAVPGLVRAGRPRSQGAIIPHRHTKGTNQKLLVPLVVEGGPSVFVSSSCSSRGSSS